MKSYLVTLADPEAVRDAEALAQSLGTTVTAVLDSKRIRRIIVQSECCCDMQDFVTELAARGELDLANPVVVSIDDRTARHLPLVNPA